MSDPTPTDVTITIPAELLPAFKRMVDMARFALMTKLTSGPYDAQLVIVVEHVAHQVSGKKEAA